MSSKFIYCSVCGEKNEAKANFCSSCGAELQKKKGNTQKQVSNTNSKELNFNTIIYSLVGLFVVGAIILYVAGVFDSPAPVQNSVGQNFTQNQNNPHAGVDLNALQNIRNLEAQVKANPNDLNALLQLAHLLNDSGFYQKAIDRYKEYLAKNPDVPDVLIDMGVCYYNLGNYEEALKAMQKGVKINPRHQIGLFNIGIVNSAKGNIAEAKKYWKMAYDVNPMADIAKKAMNLINQN
ncbi:MAG: tetratricopeptide repeat protein [Ignavibacteria bacterium]|nr:MAG: tetratricopeptide repeat protein [Ignavibacteria bacterium]